MPKIAIYTLIFLSAFILCSQNDPIFVIEIAREGVSTPKKPLICLNNGIELTEYNYTLSEYGRQQQYLLGLEMRSRYLHSIFENKCNPLNFFAYSVSRESTMLSGQVQLMGICPLGSNKDITENMIEKSYPPFDFPGKEKIAAELGLHATPHNFMPVPLHVTYNDPIFGNEESMLYPIPNSDLPDSEKEENLNKEFKPYLYRKLSEMAGIRDFESITASNIIDTVNELLWLTQTGKLRNVEMELIQSAEDFVFKYYQNYWDQTHHDVYAKMFFMEMLQKLRNQVLARLNPFLSKPIELHVSVEKPDYNISGIKFYLYEVTDLQIYAYTNILRFGNSKYIPPSSILIFELYQIEDISKNMSVEEAMKNFELKIKFNDVEIESPFCEKTCNLAQFYEKINTYFQKDSYTAE